MDKFPLTLDGRPAGELTAEREGLYTWFSARCPLPGEGLWCAWAVGDRGELRLGVLEPEGGQGVIRRRFSGRLTAPLGRVLRGEARPAGAREPEAWEPAPAPERLFRAPWLCRRLKGAQGALLRRAGETRYLALPYDPAKPFPLTTLFCFARIRGIGGAAYVVYAFDDRDRPVF
ncbi:hypothetical protein [uncultured Oscillibacter sp.]|uniref:hypothetical protein n=1 Tax=uncultured Oscillibacter sp. TaxID=876091 RepID=UPI00261D14ED|nr:hypothetical protein [uncultured Oscillibacter sp.]